MRNVILQVNNYFNPNVSQGVVRYNFYDLKLIYIGNEWCIIFKEIGHP
jgi:hypothetical protein